MLIIISYVAYELYVGIQAVRLNRRDEKELDQLITWLDDSKTMNDLESKMLQHSYSRHPYVPPTLLFRGSRNSYKSRNSTNDVE